MVAAGVPLQSAVASLGRQFDEVRYRQLAEHLAAALATGQPFSRAVRSHPWFFTDLHRSLLATAERTGSLAAVLDRLGLYEHKRQVLLHKVRASLAYPAILFAVALLVLLFLPPLVLEGLFQVIHNSGLEPPPLTAAVMALSRFLRHPLTLVVLLALAAWGLRHLGEQAGGRQALAQVALRLPVFGPLVRSLTQAHFAEALALQLDVGMPVLDALPAAAAASGNPVFAGEMQAATTALRDGATLSDSLKRVPLASGLLTTMVRVGEESGKVPGLVRRAAGLFEEEVERRLETATALLEPVVMAVMGAVFAVLLVATMLPMVRLVQTL